MKKAIKMIAILLIAFVSVNIIAKAETTSVHNTVTADASDPQNKFSITLYVNTDINIQAAAIKWHYDTDKLELLGIEKADFDGLFPGNALTGEKIIVDNATPKTGKVNLVVLKFKIKDGMYSESNPPTVTIEQIQYADDEHEYSKTLNWEIQIVRSSGEEPQNPTEICVKGDWDCNGITNSLDAVDILRYLAGASSYVAQYQGFTDNHKALLKYNNDSVLNSLDAVDILKDLARNNS